jgi:signal transduction histidine kinase
MFYDGDEEKTEVIYPNEDIIGIALQDLSKTRKSLDIVGDYDGPRFLVTNEQISRKYLDLKNRGVKIRQITEITKGNISYCKKAMEFSELRHLDGVKGTYGINDTRTFGSIIINQESKKPLHFVHSNVKPLVEQEQYLFETLWNKAIPAEKRIREIEEGIPPEVTEIWYGADNIVKKQLEIITKANATVDYCHSSESPSIIVTFEPFNHIIKQLNKRGVKQRYITEITAGNISYCKELAKYVEVRHLERVQGTLGIIDGKIYGAIANTKENHLPTEFIYSNVKSFVDQQQYFFEILWNKAIPAEQRIREIEEGRAPEKLEIIQDTQKSISRAFDIMSKTEKELLVLFATSRTFSFALEGGSADIYRKISQDGVDIKLLVPRGSAEMENEQMAKVREISPSILLRFSEVDLNTRLTVMISDRKQFMGWELRDDTLDNPYLAGGVATYSNIRALASSYATIFDNLWKINEFAENLRTSNIKLENSEKAMKEFINIAAHELRTPLQPILGLSEMLEKARSDHEQHRKLVEIIVRNAHKLENLAEDILDVTRIESGRLQLSMKEVDLYELVERTVSDFQAVVEKEFGKNEKAGEVSICLKEEYYYDEGGGLNRQRPIVLADAYRIIQVITNLLSNAVKFSEDERKPITVTRGIRKIDGKPVAFVSISDQGRGIKPEIMSRLFQKFISGSQKGTGLGLYISKNIVKAHGGEIWGESNKIGRGATFWFTLPLLKS